MAQSHPSEGTEPERGSPPWCPSNLFWALPPCTTQPTLGREKSEWGQGIKKGSRGEGSSCLNQRLCHIPAGSGLPCVLTEPQGARVAQHHTVPSPRGHSLSVPSVQPHFAAGKQQFQPPGRSWPHAVLWSQPRALSLSRPSALPNLPAPK